MKAYSGRATLKQLPYLKPGYKGKNMSDGRQTHFKQSGEYKSYCKHLESIGPLAMLENWEKWQ